MFFNFILFIGVCFCVYVCVHLNTHYGACVKIRGPFLVLIIFFNSGFRGKREREYETENETETERHSIISAEISWYVMKEVFFFLEKNDYTVTEMSVNGKLIISPAIGKLFFCSYIRHQITE